MGWKGEGTGDWVPPCPPPHNSPNGYALLNITTARAKNRTSYTISDSLVQIKIIIQKCY